MLQSDTSALFGAQAATVAGSAALSIVATRALPLDQRGILAWAIQTGLIAATLLQAGSDTAVLTSGLDAPSPMLWRSAYRLRRAPILALNIASSLLVIALLASTNVVVVAVAIAAATAALSMNSRALRAAYVGAGELRRFVTYRFTTQLVPVAIGAVFYKCTISTLGPWAIPFALLPWTISALWTLRLAGLSRTHPDPPIPLADLRDRARKLAPVTISNNLLLRLDRFMLPLFSGPGALAQYVVASTATEILNWPVQAAVDARLRHWSRNRDSLRRGDYLRFVRGAATWIMASSIPIAVLAWLLTVPVFGPNYASARQLILPLTIAAALYSMTRVLSGIASSLHDPSAASRAEVIGLIVAVPLYLLLIPSLGALGAALGSIGTYTAILITLLLYLQARLAE